MESGRTVDEREQIRSLRQDHVGRLLLEAHRAFSVRAFEKLRARGHPGLGSAHTALLANMDLEGTRITTLAERAGMTKQGMGQLVADLVGQGYLDRRPDPSDRRATIVTFTDEGWRFLRDAFEVKREMEAEYASLLGPDRFDELRASLATLVGRPNGGSRSAPGPERSED